MKGEKFHSRKKKQINIITVITIKRNKFFLTEGFFLSWNIDDGKGERLNTPTKMKENRVIYTTPIQSYIAIILAKSL